MFSERKMPSSSETIRHWPFAFLARENSDVDTASLAASVKIPCEDTDPWAPTVARTAPLSSVLSAMF